MYAYKEVASKSSRNYKKVRVEGISGLVVS